MKFCKIILILGFFLLLTSCLGWFLDKPTFTLKEVAITRFSLTEVNFLFGIEVQNPNSIDLKLKGLEYTVYINGQEVGKGRLEKEVQIAKSASTIVPIPLATDFRSLGDPIQFILSGRDLQYKIEGAAIIKATLGTSTIPFSNSGEIKIKR